MTDGRPQSDAPGVPRALFEFLAAVHRADERACTAAVERLRGAGADRVVAEETLLQAVLFFGFPRVVQAFGWLDRTWPADGPAAAARPDPVPVERHRERGLETFAAVYGEHTDRVLAMLDRHHPDFRAFVIEAAYGRILSRDGLGMRQRELIACAALALLGQRRQLVSHAYGALRAGASADEVVAALHAVGHDDAATNDLHRRITAD